MTCKFGKRSIFLYKNRVKDLLYCTGTSTQHCNKLFGKSEKKEQIYLYVSEKAMAPHSSTLAWKIPWTEEPGRLQSMGSLRVGHD